MILKFLHRCSPLWLTLLGWVLAAGFGIAWLIHLVPYSTIFGDVASWVAAIGTTAAVFYAARQVHLATVSREDSFAANQRREQQEIETGARKIAVSSLVQYSERDTDKPRSWRVQYKALNASPFPVNQVVVRCPRPGRRSFDGYMEVVVGTLLPGESYAGQTDPVDANVWEPVFGELTGICSVKLGSELQRNSGWR